MNPYRRLSVVFLILALVGCVHVETRQGQAPASPYSRDSGADMRSDPDGGGGGGSGRGTSRTGAIGPRLTGALTPAAHLGTPLPPGGQWTGDSRETSAPAMLSDFQSEILFLVVCTVSGTLFAAVVIAVAAGLAQLARLRLTRRRIEPMQWMARNSSSFSAARRS